VSLAAAIAAAALALGAPAPGWTTVSTGPAGGVVWQGRIPNTFVPSDHRRSAVYLPPGYDPKQRYPVVYLLHGMRGSPSSFWDSLRLASVADRLIATGRTRAFIAVMPVAGPTVNPDTGEWAGVWENYVVNDVVPWVDGHLSTEPSPQWRALEGLSAGGFGAIDIGLRHPGLFGTLGSWAGYFAPVFRDGPFLHATSAYLAAHDPALLVRRDARSLSRLRVRFYVSVGGNHGNIPSRWSFAFAHELRTLRLPHDLWVSPVALRRHYWSATMPSALTYAAAALR